MRIRSPGANVGATQANNFLCQTDGYGQAPAGATGNRPALPIVRDEEAAGPRGLWLIADGEARRTVLLAGVT